MKFSNLASDLTLTTNELSLLKGLMSGWGKGLDEAADKLSLSVREKKQVVKSLIKKNMVNAICDGQVLGYTNIAQNAVRAAGLK